jgi:hypothetical protein
LRRLAAEGIKAQKGSPSFHNPIVRYISRHLNMGGLIYVPVRTDLLTVVREGKCRAIQMPKSVTLFLDAFHRLRAAVTVWRPSLWPVAGAEKPCPELARLSKWAGGGTSSQPFTAAVRSGRRRDQLPVRWNYLCDGMPAATLERQAAAGKWGRAGATGA